MKIKLLNIRKNLRPNQVGLIKLFLKYLHSNSPLRKNISINFVDVRDNKITTGSELKGNISVFTKSRILIDIMRTLAHEWVHATQNNETEDSTNSLSAKLVRKFTENNPNYEAEFYKD